MFAYDTQSIVNWIICQIVVTSDLSSPFYDHFSSFWIISYRRETAVIMKLKIFITIFFIISQSSASLRRSRRSIDLSAAHSLISDTRLPGEIIPNNYTLDLRPNVEESTFTGKVVIIMTVHEPTNRVVLHAAHELEIAENEVKLTQVGIDAE